ncbi:MAG: 2-polyprenyl-3-methyl-6-methoxy-1,4-benzoquinone monooxygenase [Gammaproteobacteria bacterium]|nr:2-polyprenyl-3-methyl-6-methoxy-1,4-benzoquinone monooxygenase [Gammaproteobacteria bacterium]
MRNYSLFDQFCFTADKLLKTLSGHVDATEKSRSTPGHSLPGSGLTPDEKKHVAGLMRVNYAGEVCAQALYQGQALTARNPELKIKLTQAGLEEEDHLRWCQSRIHELNSHVSFLNPLWYAGSFSLGVIAGLCGDKWNLGFLEETEKQVTAHLEDHLTKLPKADLRTHAILTQMRNEEAEHANLAHNIGAAELPNPIKSAMNFVSRIMTSTAYWV